MQRAARPLSKILLVEDEPDIQAIARLALEALGGYEVSCCSSGREALEIVPELKPDLILLDVMMPGMDGPDTLRTLREDGSTAGIPVIFMTARVQPHEVSLFKEFGALDVIAKPFDPMRLAGAVRQIWEQTHAG